jgi:AraC family transcriptional regulator, transcriptional activator for feuABC-ybbA operon
MLSPTAVLSHPDVAGHSLDESQQLAEHQAQSEVSYQTVPGEPLSFRSGHPLHRLPLMVVQLSESRWVEGQRYQSDRGEVPSVDLVVEGTIRLVQDGRESLIGPGEVFVLKPGATHLCTAVGGAARKLHLGLGGVMAEQLITGLPDRVVLADLGSARACFDDLFALYRELPSDYHVRASQIAYRLMVQVSVAHQGGQHQAATLNPTVAAALRILETSGARDLDVRQVARTVGTSVSHLHRLFKDALGTSPLRYAREHIVSQAKDALGNTSLSCQEIAKRLGYDDPLYFSAVFKRIAGVSPREFRKRHR